MFSEFKLCTKSVTPPQQMSVLCQPLHYMQATAEATSSVHPRPSLFYGYKRKIQDQRIRETLRANYTTDLCISFILSAVNSLASASMPATLLKRLGRNKACVHLPASQIPAFHTSIPKSQPQNLTLSSPPRGCLMGGCLYICFLHLGKTNSNKLELWEMGGKSVM